MNKGKYQNLLNFMLRALADLAAEDPEWHTRTKNKVMKFLNAMVGIYYARYNDGDDIQDAIENNRAHGIYNIRNLMILAVHINAPAEVLRFIASANRTDEDYERAIEETILFVDRQAFKNKNRMMLEQTLRQLGLGPSAAKSLADFHSRI